MAYTTLLDTWEYSGYEHKVSSFADDDTYLYVGLNSNPTTILKIDTTDGSVLDTWVGTGVHAVGSSLYVQGDYLYVGGGVAGDENRGRVTQISLSTFETVASWTAGDSGDARDVYGLTGDDTYIYAALNHNPAWVAKIDPTDMSESDIYVAENIVGKGTPANCWGITYLDSYVYVSCNNFVIKLDISDMSLSDYLWGQLGYYYGISNDGSYIYATEWVVVPSGYHVRKIDPSDMTVDDSWSSATSIILDLEYDSPYLYAPDYSYLYVLDTSDMSVVDRWKAPQTQYTYIHLLGTRAYIGQYITPARVYVLEAYSPFRRVVTFEGRMVVGDNEFPYEFPFRFNVTLTGRVTEDPQDGHTIQEEGITTRRIAGDNPFPYEFPFRFKATITGRTIQDPS